MAAMCASPSHDSASAEMVAAHLQNIQVQVEPSEFVWVEPPAPNISAVDLLYPDNSWKTCIRSKHEEEYGLKVPILCKADMEIAYELGRELVNDKDSNDYWWMLETDNTMMEEWMMNELNRIEYEEHGPFVLVHNDPEYDTAPMANKSQIESEIYWEEEKVKGIPAEVQQAMLHSDWEKDKADEEMIKDMARFECETNLALLRSTPPEDRYAPSENDIDLNSGCGYSGWTRKQFPRTQRYWDEMMADGSHPVNECKHLINGHDYSLTHDIEQGTKINAHFLSERIRCNCVVICKPSNGLGYGLLACDYGLVHVANKYLPMIPDIGNCVTVTISPTDVGEKKPFPLSAVFIHQKK